MNKKTIMAIIILAANTAFAREAWMNSAEKYVRWEKPKTINLNGLIYYNTNHSLENLQSAGYLYITDAPECNISEMFIDYENFKIYKIFQTNILTEIDIDIETKTISDQFAGIMMGYFGEGALTNRTITEKYVAEFFASKVADFSITALQLSHATLLERYFGILNISPYNPAPGTTWDFPFFKDSVSVTVIKRYYVDKDNIIHYLD